jgi:hypothetical protein
MTIPLDITVVFFTLEQIGAAAVVAGDAAFALAAAPDDVIPGMFMPEVEPVEATDDAVLPGVEFDEASASVTAPSTSTAAVAMDRAPAHHTRPAILVAAQRWLARCLRSPMSPLLFVLHGKHPFNLCVGCQAGVREV